MKAIHIFLLFLFVVTLGYSQTGFNTSNNCEVNVYRDGNTSRNVVVDASVKYNIINNSLLPQFSLCSGTIINRDVHQTDLGVYMLTAWHCLNNGNDDFNFTDDTIQLIFHYQSPDGNTNSTAPNNIGTERQLSLNPNIDDDYRYIHTTRLRLVDKNWYGDMALVEILDPPPSHWNFTYAGWVPAQQLAGFRVGASYGIHHPSGDIKKISRSDLLIYFTLPWETGCRTVTKVIDFLFGWIWKRKVLTEVICNYVDIPYISMEQWTYGDTEGGSSGSGLFKDPWFNDELKIIGTLAGGPSTCFNNGQSLTYFEFYGDFRNFYLHSPVRNTLNPSHKLSLDYAGIPSRRLNCFPTMENLEGILWDFGGHQPTNEIAFNTNGVFSNNGVLSVVEGADYTINAAQGANLGPGFTVDAGASFSINANYGGCNLDNGNYKRSSGIPTEEEFMKAMAETINSIELPDKKEFNIEELIKNNNNIKINKKAGITIYPNPASSIINIKLPGINNSENQALEYVILDNTGRKVNRGYIYENTAISISHLTKGLYQIIIISENNVLSSSFMKQ